MDQEIPPGTCHAILKAAGLKTPVMLDLKYSLTIEATYDPSFFSFTLLNWRVSPALEHPWKTALQGQVGHDRAH